MARFVYHSGTSMKPVFEAAKAAPKRVIYAEGEEERVLRAVQVVVDEGIAFPVLLGRADVIARRIETLGLRLKVGETCEVVNILSDPRYPEVVAEYYELAAASGITLAIAKEAMRSRASLIAAMLLRRGDVDAMLCGTVGTFDEHLSYVRDVIGCRTGVLTLAAMNMLMLPDRQIFICDTYVNRQPEARRDRRDDAACGRGGAALRPRRRPSALLSHSSFGSSEAPEAQLMREARAILLEHDPDLMVEGEMQGDAALSKAVLDRTFPDSRLAADRGQPADHAERRCRQHRLQPAQGGGRQRHHGRPDPARHRPAGAHPGARRQRAPHRQHDRARHRRRRHAALVS